MIVMFPCFTVKAKSSRRLEKTWMKKLGKSFMKPVSSGPVHRPAESLKHENYLVNNICCCSLSHISVILSVFMSDALCIVHNFGPSNKHFTLKARDEDYT